MIKQLFSAVFSLPGIFSICLLNSNFTAYAQSIAQDKAAQHSIYRDKPATDFFEGALLGNGAMGVNVTSRPDAVVLYFGHNNIWDIRLAENHKERLGTFQEVFEKVSKIPGNLSHLTDDEWYKSYHQMTADNYSKPYPRPFPCGAVRIDFDRRKNSLLGHKLDISNGICRVFFLDEHQNKNELQIFTDMESDKLWMKYTNSKGELIPHPFTRIHVIPDPSTPIEFPVTTKQEDLSNGILSFRQTLPKNEKDPKLPQDNDKAFRLRIELNSPLAKKDRINWYGNPESMGVLEASIAAKDVFFACISLEEGLNSAVSTELKNSDKVSMDQINVTLQKNEALWSTYWNKSYVSLDDRFLEEVWYRNLYFLNCALKEGATCPGLFANWSYNDIGTAWHGDYHMNYNTQQPFWVTFSSNRLEKNLPYVKLIESLMPVSRSWAKNYYKLPGAYFPHSAYPVEMSINPYPIPDWGWEVSETPWAIQGLWWHYTYSGDRDFLEKRAYEPIKAAVEFLVAYMQRDEATDPARWKDGKFHIFPTVPPELYGLRPGFQYNYDTNVDLSLTRFAFNAFQEATKILGKSKNEKLLLSKIDKILANYPEYPTTESTAHGKIFVSVPGEHDQVVYNVPLPLFTVFPAEQHGLDSPVETQKILENTYNNQQNEGGNDIVFQNIQAARIGKLDLESFKRHVSYAMLPNGTVTDAVMQTGGRYSDLLDYKYMGKMGIWFENFALPAVINECLLQGYNGKIRLFPNWPLNKDASFTDLRTVGAFLVSAKLKNSGIQEVNIFSEKGEKLTLVNPWNSGYYQRKGTAGKVHFTGKEISLKTKAGETISFYPN